MKYSKKTLCLILLFYMFSLVSIQSFFIIDEPTVVKAATIKINKKKAILIKGQTLKLKVNGVNKKIIWKSSDKKIATVSTKGKVTAKKKGTAKITAKIGKKKAVCNISVEEPCISKNTLSLNIGATYQLDIIGTTKKVYWTSSDSSVASISPDGIITALKEGQIQITAKIENFTYTCAVTVNAPKLSASILNINIGEQATLSIHNNSSNIAWTTSNNLIASITNNGIITGIGYGSCQIIAKINDIKLTCTVNVNITDPECFPSKRLKIGDAVIESFDAKYVTFKPYIDYSKDISNEEIATYFYPHIYHIKLTGSTEKPNSNVTIRFSIMKNSSFPDIPGNNAVYLKADENGRFSIDKDLKFSSYGEMIYITSVTVH